MKNVLTSHHVITGAVKSFEPISLELAMFSKTSKFSMTQSSKWSSLTARRHHTFESRALRPRIIQLVTQILAKKSENLCYVTVPMSLGVVKRL